MKFKVMIMLTLVGNIIEQVRPTSLHGAHVCNKTELSSTSRDVPMTYTRLEDYWDDSFWCTKFFRLFSDRGCKLQRTVTDSRNVKIRETTLVQFCCPGSVETPASTCELVCNETCVGATCVAPNLCQCYEGYVEVNTTTCRPASCLDYCRTSNCTLYSNCSDDCEDACVKHACPDTHACAHNSTPPQQLPTDYSTFDPGWEMPDTGSGQVIPMDDDDPPWTVIGLSLVVLCVAIVFLVVVTLCRKKRKKKQRDALLEAGAELVETRRSVCKESVCKESECKESVCKEVVCKESVFYSTVDPPTEETATVFQYSPYEDMKAKPTSTQNYPDGYSLHEKVRIPCEAKDNVSEENILYGKVQKPPDTIDNVSEENILYGKVQKPPNTIDNVSEENILYAKVQKPPDTINNVSEENNLYSRMDKPPVTTENVSEDKMQKLPDITNNLPEDNCLMKSATGVTLNSGSLKSARDSEIYYEINATETSMTPVGIPETMNVARGSLQTDKHRKP